MVSGMLRMVGVDEHKLGLMALNVLVYLAEFLAKNLLGMPSELENEIPEYRSIVNNEGIISAMWKLAENANEKSERVKQQFLDPELPEKVIHWNIRRSSYYVINQCFQIRNTLPQTFMGADLGCVQLFLCKMDPAFWSMQSSTKNFEGLSITRSLSSNFNRWLDAVYEKLPTLNQLQSMGKRCNQQYQTCDLIDSFY